MLRSVIFVLSGLWLGGDELAVNIGMADAHEPLPVPDPQSDSLCNIAHIKPVGFPARRRKTTVPLVLPMSG
jgi:hypothetical protein